VPSTLPPTLRLRNLYPYARYVPRCFCNYYVITGSITILHKDFAGQGLLLRSFEGGSDYSHYLLQRVMLGIYSRYPSKFQVCRKNKKVRLATKISVVWIRTNQPERFSLHDLITCTAKNNVTALPTSGSASKTSRAVDGVNERAQGGSAPAKTGVPFKNLIPSSLR